jgi:nanoRNase/pAp phosphatase (c-di-AMP/oligoRNAs hydrolase)
VIVSILGSFLVTPF